MRERDYAANYVAILVTVLVGALMFAVAFEVRDSVREEVVRCLRAPDAESAAMACPQWMQEARR